MDCKTAEDFIEEHSRENSGFRSNANGNKIVANQRFDLERIKSSSLSRLPDRPALDSSDGTSSTLPSNLSSVKGFNSNLSEGRSVNIWYDPAESFGSGESISDEEDADEKIETRPNHDTSGSSEDQDIFPGDGNDIVRDHQLHSCPADRNGNVPSQGIDLSMINTETLTFVRSSALDILAKFPKQETVLSSDRRKVPEMVPNATGNEVGSTAMADGNLDNSRVNGASEDICEHVESAGSPVVNAEPSAVTPQQRLAVKKRDASDHKIPEVVSWSSTSDVDPGWKKKRLFYKGKKKAMYEISPTSLKEGQPDFQENNTVSNSNPSMRVSPERVNTTKSKQMKKANSSAWISFFRGKSEAKDETPKKEKRKKERKPVQKSQTFNSGNKLPPRNTQFNRMDSFRKLFKRPRDGTSTQSAIFSDGKQMEGRTCLEISPPIVKTEFLSDNLIDREVILALRDRAYQLEKRKNGHDKKDLEVDERLEIGRLGSDEKDGDGNHFEVSTTIPNGNLSEDATVAVDGEDCPVPPVRWKHLQRKRLSRSTEDGGTSNITNNNAEEALSSYQNPDNPKMNTDGNDDCGENAELNLNGNVVELNTGGTRNVVDASELDNISDLDKAINHDNDNQTTIIRVDHEPNSNDSSIPHSCHLENGSERTAHQTVASLPSPGNNVQGGPCEQAHEVFEDCKDDSEFNSFPSSTLGDEDQRMPAVQGAMTETGKNRRWLSDVSSAKSKGAIVSAKKKISQSFSEGATRPSLEPSAIGTHGGTYANERSPIQKRSMSIFAKMPSVKLEQSEPPTLVTDLVPTVFPTISTDRRSQIILELFMTERTYVRSLETLIELFKKPLLAGKVDEKDVDLLFSNINDIFALNKDLLFLLWEKVKHWSNEQCIGQIFVDMEERFKIYAIYCKNFDKGDAMYKQKIKRNKDFERFLKTCYQDPLCQPGLDLPAYLITVVQRIPRYLLMLKDLCKKTPASHPDYNNLKLALTRMNKVAEYINSQLQEVHGQKAMQELRSTVIGLKAYEVKGRTLLKESEVSLMNPNKLYKCLLFNDIMVFAVHGSKDRSEIEMTLELRTLWFEDLKKLDPQTNKCDAIELYTPHRPYTMYACSRTDKRVWIQKLRTAIVNLLYGPDCEDPESMDISCRKASDTYIDGSVYCGEYVNGKRHGHGVMAWPNRTRYEGSWADDERHGHGQLTYYTGEKYVGSWVADKKDGDGKQTYVNGDAYSGQWSEGKMLGEGVIKFANGDSFKGEMQANEVEGNGEISCISGLVYKGEWKKSKRHGQGHLFFPNGNEYRGEMLNDRICGYGRMIYFNGDEYCGEWVNEMRHGIGNLKFVYGAIYDGQWNNDFMNGQGKMSYPNGDEYSGTWYQNKRVGKGQLMYAHGDTYNGQWQDDVMHGKGIMYYKDASIYEGNWELGERHGNGRTTYCDESVYEGEYRDGFRYGRGKLVYANSVSFVGEWKSNKLEQITTYEKATIFTLHTIDREEELKKYYKEFEGSGIFSDPNTEYSYQGDWVCGKREGNGIEISYRTRYEGGWKADMRHGTGTEKSHAGHTFEGTWKENRKHGKGLRTLRSGVKEEQQWHEGHLLEVTETVAEDLPLLPRR